MILRNTLTFFVTFLLVVGSASVFADTFIFEDTTSEVPGSVFTLSITPTDGQNFSATLMVQTIAISPDDWFIDYITLHLDGGTRPDITSFNVPTNWNIIGSGDSEVNVLKRGGDFPQKSWIGFYTDGIAGGNEDIDEGVLLDGGNATWTFDFTLAGGSILNPSPSIQVGYFNYDENGRGGRGKIFFTQMSQTVPEPSTLILLLSGTGILAGAAGFRRKMK